MQGVGYFLHFHQDYIDFDQKFEACGGRSDAYEVLALHFNTEVENLVRFIGPKNKPVCLHTAVMDLGQDSTSERPGLKMLQEQVAAVQPYSVTEHHAVLKSPGGDEFGIFFPPPELPAQKQVISGHLKALDQNLNTKVLVENPIFSYELKGNQAKRRVEFFNETVRESGCKMHLSLSNIAYSNSYGARIDPDEYLAHIDLSLVEQIHLYVNNQAQMKSAPKSYTESEKWLKTSLEQLLKHHDVKPLIFFELEARTPALAEPEFLRDSMDWARSLLA
ncbi:hypothetical protein VA7868_03642 [Vibrio aerogenes CECT 7868]|uniref:Xylose isomerase-like TIM barrel n=1 Tax=Vibrio aerogenes CECT 7868 TaxID=1216006 RepID=A0A1M6AQY2_9VIBR|nr:DUF692 family multinuclear iron-containing protein [Vibrio aerogenes]SHI38841.1 hypothetical protein VA7868_03642 [Vibrio aerogenes CECT 7868]